MGEENDLVSILKEAERCGFNQDQRHEVSIRYQLAMDEFISCTDVLRRSGFFDKIAYGVASMEHAAKKARNYINRHAQRP